MRLYKMEITSIPEESLGGPYVNEDGEEIRKFNPLWKPEGWEKHVDECIDMGYQWAGRAKRENYRFFWPSERGTYLTKQAAEYKAWIVRRWGGTAIVLEAEVGEFVETTEAQRLRDKKRDIARAERLREKAQVLALQAALLEDRALKGELTA